MLATYRPGEEAGLARRGLEVAGAHARRYREVVGVLARHGIGRFLDRLAAGHSLMFWRRPRENHALAPEQRLRLAFEELGPTFIKLGQALSVRSDLLPPRLVHELATLQDAVPPVPLNEVVTTIERGLGRPIAALFAELDPRPLGSASIAQVHQARLPAGELVAVKVRRPGIAAVIDSDIAILTRLARVLERRLPDAALYDPRGLVAQFARSIRLEQDLAREGRLIERFAENCAADPRFVFPRVYWTHTCPEVLTMECIDGVRLADIIENSPASFDRAAIASRGADAILQQILVDGLFHADPHPGNILVRPGNVICLLDFGIVGHLDRRNRDKLVALLNGIYRRDRARAARALVAIAEPAGEIDYATLEQDLGEIIEMFAGARLGDLVVLEVWSQVLGLVSHHRLRLPPNLMLLMKALTTMEAVGRSLDPSFKMIEHAAPCLDRLMRARMAPRAMATRVTQSGEELAETLSTLPEDVVDVINRLKSGRLHFQISHPESHELADALLVAVGRFGQALMGAALIIGIALVMRGSTSSATWWTTVAVMVAAWLGLVFGLSRPGRGHAPRH